MKLSYVMIDLSEAFAAGEGGYAVIHTRYV